MPVYKYMSSKGFNDMFKNSKTTLLYRRIDKLNDPYENLIGIEEYASEIFDLVKSQKFLENLEDYNLVSALLVGAYQVLKKDEICENIKKSFYVLSLSRSFKNLLMWAHYADMHKGVVIELDENNPTFIQDKESFIDSLCPVSYTKNRKPTGFIKPQTYSELASLLGVTARELLKIKSKDWDYEEEMRQVLIDTRPMNKLFSREDLLEAPDLVYCNDFNAWILTVDSKIVNKIYLGSNFDTEDKSNQFTIESLRGKIPIYKMSLQKDRYSLKWDKYV